MAHLFPAARRKVDQVKTTHNKVTKQLTGEELNAEDTLFKSIEEAARIGRKKGIMTEARIRDMCDTYLARFGQ